MQACSNCGAPVAPQARFCPNCAAPIGMGVGMGAGYGSMPPYQRRSQAPLIIAIIVLVVLIAGGAAAIILLTKKSSDTNSSGTANSSASIGVANNRGPSNSQTNKPSEALRRFLKAAEDGNASEFLNLVDRQYRDQVKQKAGGRSMEETFAPAMQVMSSAIKSQGGIASIETKQEQINGNTAMVDIEIKHKNGAIEPLTIKLVKEGNDWKVDMFDWVQRNG